MLELIDIHKSYSVGPVEVKVLKGVSLTIHKGDMTSIMGASGGGKSTIMNIIGLLDKPTSGSYLIDDSMITYDNDDRLSRIRNEKIGFVFQQYHLLARMTALENVGLPLIYRGLAEDEIISRSRAFLKKVDMDDRGHHKPFELSGGQQQRVAIARALAGSPTILLADEPTGALDPKVGEEIMNLFIRLNQEEGITIVIITHAPEVGQICRRRLMLRDGLIEEQP